MTTKKKNLCKTFRLFDFHTYDNSTEKEELKWYKLVQVTIMMRNVS